MKKNQKGFTLIELLVVIAILGLLATLAIVSLRGAQQRARDTKRISDVKSIQTAVELYYSENSTGYPEPGAATWAGLNTELADFITGLPTPPDSANEQYIYAVETTNNQNYVIAADPGLEDGDHQALDQDADGSYGNGGVAPGENWGATTSIIVSGGVVPALVECDDDIYCLVE